LLIPSPSKSRSCISGVVGAEARIFGFPPVGHAIGIKVGKHG